MKAPSEEAAFLAAPSPSPEGGTAHRLKLGLALAGGGFRAALFHLGVLRRLAELDVLRRVEVLSTVSGGSVVGGLYSLLVRREGLRGRARSREDYLAITAELERRLIGGVQENLRNRLFEDPVDLFRAMVRPYALSNRMARLYERYVFRDVVAEIRQLEGGEATWTARRPGFYPLSRLRAPGAAGESGVAEVEGLEDHNYAQAQRPDGAAIPHHIFNATAVNTGGRFGLSSSEVGGWYLGYIRFREVEEVRARIALVRALEQDDAPPADLLDAVPVARWALAEGAPPADPGPWADVFGLKCLDTLLRADFGLLRRAKLPAWYLVRGREREAALHGGSRAALVAQFAAALREIDDDLAAAYAAAVAAGGEAVQRAVMAFVVETYYVRSALVFDRDVAAHLADLSVGDAVAASAAFPPVFSPFIKEGIYTNTHVGRLGLTDGGVFDNAGLFALLDEGCTAIIASDTGGPPPRSRNASTNRLSLIARVASIATSDLGVVQRGLLRERRRASRVVETALNGRGPGDPLHDYYHTYGLRGLAYFHTASGLAGTPHPDLDPEALPDAGTVSAVRTDLDAFNDVETAALMNRGYALADAYVRTYLGDLEREWRPEVPWADVPYALPYDAPALRQRQDDALRVGGERFFRALKLRLPLAWAATLVVGLGLVGLAWAYGGLVADALARPPAWAVWGLRPVLGLGAGPLAAALMLLLLGLVVAGGLRRTEPRRPRGRGSGGRAWAGKWLPWALLYLLFALAPGLLLLTGVVAVLLGAYALINHVFFQRPLLAALRLPDAPWHRAPTPPPAVPDPGGRAAPRLDEPPPLAPTDGDGGGPQKPSMQSSDPLVSGPSLRSGAGDLSPLIKGDRA